MARYLDILQEPLALAEDIYYHLTGPPRKLKRKLKEVLRDFYKSERPAERVLIACHGWGQRGDAFEKFYKVIKEEDLPIRLERFEYRFGQDIRISAEQLSKKIKEYSRPVDLIGHSEGGLVVRYAVQAIDSENVDTVITVATPHNGTAIAALALPLAVIKKSAEQLMRIVFGRHDYRLGSAAWQMFGLNGWKPDGFLDYLNSLPIPDVRFINAYPILDELVWPHSGRWEAEGVENIELGPGHVRAIMSEKEIKKILSAYLKNVRP